MKYYSPSTGGFYCPVIHKKAIPSDAIQISDVQHHDFLIGLSGGKRLEVDQAGVLILIDASIDIEAIERAWRDAELSRVAWQRDRHRDELDMRLATTLGNDQFEQLLGYMQALRNWPEAEDFPATDQRPVPPPWIADQTQ
ncbi:phage tail protein [Pseudomonas sp. 148P]|uniref:Phage tail protein n=1 Tax=Pseudomonas ulcerans TaxID=3115852 RepID=A0ABU7HW21_9PSED|nr:MULTISPECIES: phage tail protein [unclassified Pseudomonas]MEE1922912.1 phage tail protein [Pseudomonas sp. 147P]MEE1935762.1 phage tail protein [Pseudomonas sp. 148P]